MKILGIETSCDETALAVLEGGGTGYPHLRILANEISTQIEIHRKYGGVVPNLAKREHGRNLVPVLLEVLKNTESKIKKSQPIQNSKLGKIEEIFEREDELLKQFKKEILPLEKPDIDVIAVTCGPGLEPALWVGINFARALSLLWDMPLIGVDHMEGHISANFIRNDSEQKTMNNEQKIQFPALALTVSGGHTQLVLMPKLLEYRLLGETLDDAAGEAFDKVARLLGLPYPGGPEIARVAQDGKTDAFDFPRPVLTSKDYNFSFSGLKTAVLYTVREMSENELKKKTADLAASFQQAVIDVLISKTLRAAKEFGVKTIMMGGGVAANQELRQQLGEAIEKSLQATSYQLPPAELATDNAAMIAAAGYMHFVRGERSDWKTLEADANKIIAERL